jgi:hypothetical protein
VALVVLLDCRGSFDYDLFPTSIFAFSPSLTSIISYDHHSWVLVIIGVTSPEELLRT